MGRTTNTPSCLSNMHLLTSGGDDVDQLLPLKDKLLSTNWRFEVLHHLLKNLPRFTQGYCVCTAAFYGQAVGVCLYCSSIL